MFEDYKKLAVDFEQLRNLEILEPTFLKVNLGDIPFEFLINPNQNSQKSIIFGSGAYNAEKQKPPIFNRHKWKEDFGNVTTLYYNDPTLYLDKLNLGWGYGNKERHFLQDIAKILELLFDKLSLKETLFLGSSGGGFTSLILASILKGKAFVNNPQTIVTNYYKRFVKELYQAVYPESSINGFQDFRSDRINVLESFKKNRYVPEIFYAQNLACKHDVNNHMLPFVEGISKIQGELISDKITMYYYHDKVAGHNPMPKEDTIRIVNEMLTL